MVQTNYNRPLISDRSCFSGHFLASRRLIQLVIMGDPDLGITFMVDVGKFHQALLCNRVDSEGVEVKSWSFTSTGKTTVEHCAGGRSLPHCRLIHHILKGYFTVIASKQLMVQPKTNNVAKLSGTKNCL